MDFPARAIPIFPLPGSVLLPGAVLPLQLFEGRYRDMIADEMGYPERERYIGLALLQEGHESSYYTHHAPIHTMLCLGQVFNVQPLPNGRSFIELLGLCRSTIKSELYDLSYRRAYLSPVEAGPDLLPEEEDETRDELTKLFNLPGQLGSIARQIMSQSMKLEDTIDHLAQHLLGPEAWSAKQMVLDEPRLDLRARILLTLQQRNLLRGHERLAADWRPPVSEN